MAIKIDIIPKYKDILKGFTENDNIIKNYYLKDNYGFALLNKFTVLLFIVIFISNFPHQFLGKYFYN